MPLFLVTTVKLPQKIISFKKKKKKKTVDSYTLTAEMYIAQQFLFVSL